MAGVAVVAGTLGLAVARFLPGGRPAADAPAATAVARPRITGEFELLDTAGNAVRWADMSGRWQLVFFGFTQCPEACPTTLRNAVQALADPGLDGKDLRVLFISVDPGRDTAQVVREYVGNFGAGVTGLTGDPAGIAAAAAAFGVYFEKMPAMADGGYMVNHTASLFLLGPTDEILETIPYGATAPEIADAVKRHL
jgi:protein SCO1/2